MERLLVPIDGSEGARRAASFAAKQARATAAEVTLVIIMGSRGLSPMKELLLGSVGAGVVRKAYCPVTIVR